MHLKIDYKYCLEETKVIKNMEKEKEKDYIKISGNKEVNHC